MHLQYKGAILLCFVMYIWMFTVENHTKSIPESNHIPIQLHNQRSIIIYAIYTIQIVYIKYIIFRLVKNDKSNIYFYSIIYFILFYKSQLFLNHAHAHDIFKSLYKKLNHRGYWANLFNFCKTDNKIESTLNA